MLIKQTYRKVTFLLVIVLGIIGNSCQVPFLNIRSSVYTKPFYDTGAVYFTTDRYTIHGDGKTDDSAALQTAINDLEMTFGTGIVFIPEGKYCLANTVNIWRGIRLIGYGKSKPIFVVPENLVAFQYQKKIVLHFRDKFPQTGELPNDADAVSFGSGLSNIVLKIAKNNPAAIGVRFNVAQLSALQHIDFILESGYAAIEQLGNLVEDCTITGGDYGIITGPSPSGGQVLVMDCRFTDQKEAAILCDESGMTVLRTRFAKSQHAVFIKDNSFEKLFLRDCFCEDLSKSAFLISHYNNQKTQVNMLNIQCNRVPNFLHFQDRNAPVNIDDLYYVVEYLTHGMIIQRMLSDSYEKLIKTTYRFQALKEPGKMIKSDIPRLPTQKKWINITEYGAKGDGYTDDTIAFIKAIGEHKTIYVPSGRYVISKTLQLRKDTNIVGLHPFATQIVLADSTFGFTNPDSLNPMLVTPAGGKNIISGIGLDAGNNSGVVQIQWLAGVKSCLNDAWFGWGSDGMQEYPPAAGPSLWVTSEGGGVFKNIWSANGMMHSGLQVSNTQTKSIVYLMSVQNHHTQGLVLENARNWSFYALFAEGDDAKSDIEAISMHNCQNIDFNNLYLYRIGTQTPATVAAVHLDNCDNITLRGMHNFSSGFYPYAGSAFIVERNFYITEKELAFLQLKKF